MMEGDVGLAGVAIDSVEDMKVVTLQVNTVCVLTVLLYRPCLMESHWIKCLFP